MIGGVEYGGEGFQEILRQHMSKVSPSRRVLVGDKIVKMPTIAQTVSRFSACESVVWGLEQRKHETGLSAG